jgi:hypothetical protein
LRLEKPELDKILISRKDAKHALSKVEGDAKVGECGDIFLRALGGLAR